jgi:hypothetical protein
MASQTINAGTVFPEGTSVGAYPASNWSPVQLPPTGAAVGSPTNTQTVSGGAVTFTGLADGTQYYAGASVSGTWRYVSFRTPGVPDAAGVEIARAEITANQLGISTIADVTGLAISYTVGTRPVELQAHFPLLAQVTTAGIPTLFITDAANADIARCVATSIAAGSFGGGLNVFTVITAPGTYTHKVRAQTTAGTLTIGSQPKGTGGYQAFLRARTL